MTVTDTGSRRLTAADLPDHGLRPTAVRRLVDAASAEVIEIDGMPAAFIGAAAIDVTEGTLLLIVPAGQAPHTRETVIRQLLAEVVASADARTDCPGLARLAAAATVTDFGPIRAEGTR